ncbi:MAG: MaoC family dehydratase N-terminal domain-containing protein, partial [Myxococcota bacterium]
MTGDPSDPLRARLEAYVGKPLGATTPTLAPDEVNVPMIRHWVDALDDCNPVYLDEEFAATTRFGGIVAPPAMLQTWTMPRPKIAGIAERGGAPNEITSDN